ncbi:hypothetical protein [Parabacteroides sp.]|uniref:ATP-grasp domain-containing protein n=1 Tax=Parabacteroides sp. TaxID=1869337 RepID=UPI00257A099F|nr:hypothetical protein [Parabacteroides sp.]MBS1380110.1 hypothetical protein [Parabacteroides sp.]
MKIAIHHTAADWSFSNYWVEYCRSQKIDYKIVNAYDSDIVEQVQDCDAFMWHHNHMIHKDRLFAKALLFSLETAGIKVFPNFYTGWHFDDKLGQKYLLESIGAPLVPSHAFFDFDTARKWIEETTFPKVFKLRGGSGSTNVMLVKTRKDALKLARKAIKRGIPIYNKRGALKEAFRRYRMGVGHIVEILKAMAHFVLPTPLQRASGKDVGYAYFQDFIPDNRFDIRIIVIGDKAYGIQREVRTGDFRASGSGMIHYDRKYINEQCVKVAFEVSEKLQSQCTGFDFVFDQSGTPLIVEIGYGFVQQAYEACPGYWDRNICWHEGKFNPMGWIVENLKKSDK